MQQVPSHLLETLTARPLVTLTTDFGLREYFVGAMKGAMLSVHPGLHIVDISHQVSSHDILEGAFTLRCAYQTFPAGTIHVVVVDPGVGSERRALILAGPNHIFVGPDNGVFSLVLESEPIERVISITAEHYFRKPVSHTFHGRDIFGPVAAWIAWGIEPGKFGEEVSDCVRLALPGLKKAGDRALQGVVLHVDRFGNVITNFTPSDLEAMGAVRGFTVAGREVFRLVRSYSEGTPGEPFAVIGSAGFYEIAVQAGSAASLLRVERGAEVVAHLA